MNEHKLNSKIRRDTDRVKKDLHTLVGDSAARFDMIEKNASDATGKVKADVSTWVEDGINRMSEGLVKISDDAREAVVDTAETVKKDVTKGLRQYNAKAIEVARKIPGGIGEKAVKYPWVVVSIALGVGFVLGTMLRPYRQSPWVAQI